jgi:hypothetical protein
VFVLSLKEIIIIIIIIPEILFDTEYIAFSVFGLAFLLLARQSLYKYNSVLARSSFPIISVSSVIKIFAPIALRIGDRNCPLSPSVEKVSFSSTKSTNPGKGTTKAGKQTT